MLTNWLFAHLSVCVSTQGLAVYYGGWTDKPAMCTTQSVAVVHRKNGLLVKKMSLLLLSSFHWPTHNWPNRREKCLLCLKWIDYTNWSLNTPSQELLEYGWMDLLVTGAVTLSWSLTWLPLESNKRQASGWVHAGMSRRDKLRGDSLLQTGSSTSQGPRYKVVWRQRRAANLASPLSGDLCPAIAANLCWGWN